MDVVTDLPSDAQAPEPVQQGKGALNNPAVNAETRAVLLASAGDERRDSGGADKLAVLVVVVGAIGVEPLWSTAGPSTTAPDRRNRVDQRHQLGDIMPVPAGQGGCQRDAGAVGDDVVFRPGTGSVYRAGAGFRPPFNARTCDPSTAARDQSS